MSEWLPSVDLLCAVALIVSFLGMQREIAVSRATVEAWADRCKDIERQRDDLERQLDEYRDLISDTKSGLNDLVAQLEREEEVEDDSE